MTAHRFSYVEVDPSLGAASALPYMPISLALGGQQLTVSGLVDSGATLNVLPWEMGFQLGAAWKKQTVAVALSGNLAVSEARALLLTGHVADFAPVRLAFAWARTNSVPVILGQVNFSMEFDVYFFRSRLLCEANHLGWTLRARHRHGTARRSSWRSFTAGHRN